MDHATERKPRLSRPLALFRLLHSIMVALIAGAGVARSPVPITQSPNRQTTR